MRRTKLIWFAAGLFVATVISLATPWLEVFPATQPNHRYIIVSDRQGYPEGVPFPKEQVKEKNPEILRECGIQNFVIWQAEGTPDGIGVSSGFEPSEQTDASVTCVLAAIKDGHLLSEFKSAGHPNELAPVFIRLKEQKVAPKNAQTH